MASRQADAEWHGDLKNGGGRIKLASGAFEGPYGYKSRFEEGPGTNPEELIGGALAGCFTMALSLFLANNGFTAERLHTKANVHLTQQGGGFAINKIDLELDGAVPGISADQFGQLAEEAKKNCPVSKALAGTEITLNARLS
jgi:osmotically inducible protein OsmC